MSVWQTEVEDMVKYHEKNVVALKEKLEDICNRTASITWEEYEFQVRNLENAIANEKFFIHKLKEQLKCEHSWECLGGGGQIMTDICRKCGASHDY
ncbi:hypothetical protein IACHDJAJ_00041 [Aeromonas phage vB_AdhS_TS3]|nr:hypothetical protein IACHDJAJ_00041 [Aeromonas phage vB_AdhS_TS3]